MVISKINQKSLYIIYSILSISILSLFFIKNTYADESSNLNYSVTVEPALNITTSANKVSLDLNPLNHDFDSRDLTVSVSTNNETGYKLYVNTEKTTNNPNGNKLIEKDDPNLYIETLSSETPENDFTANRWGYKLDSTNTKYSPFTPGTLVLSSKTIADGKATNDITTMVFAAKVGYETKAGTYALALNFQATANPHIPYMQNLDPTLCVADEPTTVIDARDEKSYTVQRLKDGKCWMTANLNLAGGTKLYSETSNVPDGYPESAGVGYYTLPDSSSTGFSNDSIAYVYNSGNETTNQSDCTSTKACNSYYSFLAATAGAKNIDGSDVVNTGHNAPFSICPKGWRLPTATTSDANPMTNNNWKTSDFYKLVVVYGVTALESNYYSWSAPQFNNNAGPGTTADFLMGGHYGSGGLAYGGQYGHYSASTSGPSTGSCILNNGTSYLGIQCNDSRRTGYSIRCLLAE